MYKNEYDSMARPQNIMLDITGVNDLKIEMYGEGNMESYGMSSVLANVYLIK